MESATRKFFDQLENGQSAKFVRVNGYTATNGEVTNRTILVNIDVMNRKKKDVELLESVSTSQLKKHGNEKGIALDIMRTALTELIDKGNQNLSANKEDRTAQSQAQTDAYIHVTPSIKILKETGEIHITGITQQKEVIVPGEYKKVNSADKTIAKRIINKFAGCLMPKFRTMKLNRIGSIKLSGDTFIIVCK
jgi:hypothetical protein